MGGGFTQDLQLKHNDNFYLTFKHSEHSNSETSSGNIKIPCPFIRKL